MVESILVGVQRRLIGSVVGRHRAPVVERLRYRRE